MHPGRPICGHPVEFRNLNRPRTDLNPVCFRPPHEGDTHMSQASWERSVLYQREHKRGKRERARKAREQQPVLSEAPASVTA